MKATILQRLIVVLTIYLYLHLSQKSKYMKTSKLSSFIILLFIQAVVTTVFAQDKPKAGDTISGIISDKYGPAMMINVTERDSLDRVVAHSLTDFWGYFSFRLVSPENRIRIITVGYETVDIPIDTNLL